MIENITSQPYQHFGKQGYDIVLDLGANIECNSKNLVDFSIMGSANTSIV